MKEAKSWIIGATIAIVAVIVFVAVIVETNILNILNLIIEGLLPLISVFVITMRYIKRKDKKLKPEGDLNDRSTDHPVKTDINHE